MTTLTKEKIRVVVAKPGLDGHDRGAKVIARAFRDEERAVFKDLKQSLGRDIALRPDAQLHHEQFDLMAVG